MSEFRKANTDYPFFITLPVVGWIDVFTRSDYCDEFLKNLEYCRKNKGLKIYAYCIMSSHIHLIVSADDIKLPGIIRDLKSYTAKRLLKLISEHPTESRKEWMLAKFEKAGRLNPGNDIYQFWQHDNHPIELASFSMFKEKLDYIHNNPVVAGFVTEAYYWKYSSAIDYSGGTGVLEIDFV